jgi:hypothetical protein
MSVSRPFQDQKQSGNVKKWPGTFILYMINSPERLQNLKKLSSLNNKRITVLEKILNSFYWLKLAVFKVVQNKFVLLKIEKF